MNNRVPTLRGDHLPREGMHASPKGCFIQGTHHQRDASSKGCIVKGIHRPRDASSKECIIHGMHRPGDASCRMHHPRDASSRGRIIQGCIIPVTHYPRRPREASSECIVHGTHCPRDASFIGTHCPRNLSSEGRISKGHAGKTYGKSIVIASTYIFTPSTHIT